MTYAFQKINKYFFYYARLLGKWFDILNNRLTAWINSEELKKSIEDTELRIQSILPSDRRWLGIFPLAFGLFILFAVFGGGFLDWLVLFLFFAGTGILFAQKDHS
jgi:hypothetical protein